MFSYFLGILNMFYSILYSVIPAKNDDTHLKNNDNSKNSLRKHIVQLLDYNGKKVLTGIADIILYLLKILTYTRKVVIIKRYIHFVKLKKGCNVFNI